MKHLCLNEKLFSEVIPYAIEKYSLNKRDFENALDFIINASSIDNKIKLLKFNNPIFNHGNNITIRNGTKWLLEPVAFIYLPKQNKYALVELRRISCKFNEIKLFKDLLLSEHDPECRTYDGLLKCMQNTYENFTEKNDITIVRFDLDLEKNLMYDSISNTD